MLFPCLRRWHGWKSRTLISSQALPSVRGDLLHFFPAMVFGREFRCLFPFGLHLLCYPLCELSLPCRVCLSHGEVVGDWTKQTQIVVTIPVKCFALRLLSALSHSSHQKCSSVLRTWKWVLASGLWRCSQLIFSTALFLLVLSLCSMIPGPLVSPAWGHDVPTEILWFITMSIFWVWVLWYLWPQIVKVVCCLSSDGWIEEKLFCYSIPKYSAPWLAGSSGRVW